MNTYEKLSGIFINVSLQATITSHPYHSSNTARLLLFTVPRNYDPSLHPFEAQREYAKALNAVKLERVFAKPFVSNLEGHKDAVSCVCKHPSKLSTLMSGAYDGEVKTWSLTHGTCTRTILAHDGIVRGMTYVPDGERFITVGDDKTIKTYSAVATGEEEPLNTIISKVWKYQQ